MLSTAVTNLCQAVTNEKALATVYYQELLAALNANQNAETYFPQTLAYLNNPTEKKAFVAGGQSCVQFFVGLEVPLVADLQASGFSLQSATEKAVQYIENAIAKTLANRS